MDSRKVWWKKAREALPLTYFIPVFSLVIISFATLLLLLTELTAGQDSLQKSRELDAVRSSIEEATQLADRDLRDYAFWDDAARNLLIAYDQEWADANLGPYLGGEQGYDYVVVFDRKATPEYLYTSDTARPEALADGRLGAGFNKSVRRALGAQTGDRLLISGFSRSGNDLYLFAVASIEPLTSRVSVPRGRHSAIAIARKIEGDIAPWYNSTPNPISLTNRAPLTDRASLVLHDPFNDPIGHLEWVPERPGSSLQAAAWPAITIFATLFLSVAMLIVLRGKRAIEAITSSQAEIRTLALRDPLTELPNRRAISQCVAASLSEQKPVSLLLIDLDGFKSTNDVYGHSFGDDLLRVVAKRFSNAAVDCLLGRLGGDEFAVLVADDASRAAAVGNGLLAALARPIEVRDISVYLGCSIGLASGNGRDLTDEELMRRADIAMYAAKSRGKHRLVVYDSSLDHERISRRTLEEALRKAIRGNSIEVAFQTIVDAHSQKQVGVEALARWDHPELGRIPPEQFISIAEQCGLIVPLGQQILAKACASALHWDLDLAVNLSPAQFWDSSLVASVQEVLRQTGFPAQRLELEITEGYLMKQPDAARNVLEELRSIGVKIALDDFGSGFASIGYLQKLGFDRLKIDRSIIACSKPTLIRSIVSLGKALDLQITAEGIETEAQAILMRAAGCDRLQGWYFGRPIDSTEINRSATKSLRQVG